MRLSLSAAQLREFRLQALLLVSLLSLHSVEASWGGDWGKSQESKLAFEDFHSRNRSNRRFESPPTRSTRVTSCLTAQKAQQAIASCFYRDIAIHAACVSQLKYQYDCSESFKYTREDLLIAIPGQTERLSLIEASRPWRKGVDTFVALEKPLTERDAPKGFLVCKVHELRHLSVKSMT